jgi:hypothetical protein
MELRVLEVGPAAGTSSVPRDTTVPPKNFPLPKTLGPSVPRDFASRI